MKSLSQYITEGAWGYDILQNDSVRDELCGNFARKVVIPYLQSIFIDSKEADCLDNRWVAIGIYVYTIDNFFMNDGELMSTLGDYDIIDKLEIMVNNSFNDKRWLNNWSNPIEMVQSLNKILEKIKIYRGKIK